MGAEEPPELVLIGPSSPRRLLLEGAERSKLALSVDDLFHGGGTERADQLVLQVCDTHIETESLHVGASQVGAEGCPLESALEVALLGSVTQAGESGIKPTRAEYIQEATDVGRTPHWHYRNALSLEVPTTALGQRFERELVADTFNKDDGARDQGSFGRPLAFVPAFEDDHGNQALRPCLIVGE